MTIPHASDCALHTAPAFEPGPCDCGATDILERLNAMVNRIDAALGDRKFPGGARDLLAECAITIKALRERK